MSDSDIVIIGPVEKIGLPEQNIEEVPARIDTGARTSAMWASNYKEANGKLSFTLFAKGSPYYTGKAVTTDDYHIRKVASSTSDYERRYTVWLVVVIRGRRIRAKFTLANRSRQTYPILLGRNVLRGKFIVDVKGVKPGKPTETTDQAKDES